MDQHFCLGISAAMPPSMTSPWSSRRSLVLGPSGRHGPDQKQLFRRFRQTAFHFERPRGAVAASLVVVLLVLVALMQVGVQYLLNLWNRDFFNALETHREQLLWRHAGEFFLLATASVVLAVASVWARMLAQRRWRAMLTLNIVRSWLRNDHFRHLNPLNHGNENPEYRIAEDVRVATEAPVDLAVALFISAVTATTFFNVLWQVGGGLELHLLGARFYVPGYLVVGVVLYAGLATAGMMWVGRRMTEVIRDKNQAEAEFRAAATLLRESGEGKTSIANASIARESLQRALPEVFREWRALSGQLMRTTWVSHANLLLTPVVALFLCTPKYLTGTMSLGELIQAAAAFATVVGAFNWVVDNFQRLADWTSSVDRVATLLLALDEVSAADERPSELESEVLVADGTQAGPANAGQGARSTPSTIHAVPGRSDSGRPRKRGP
jgi:putative ATP-binding cassette transporter